MFEPILQLQALRYRFLLLREFCWRTTGIDARATYFGHAALLGWRASRLIGGWLQAHPNLQHHPKTTFVGRLLLRAHAAALGILHAGARRRTLWLHAELERIGMRCADIRAVTSCVAINEILGRRQPEIAALLRVTGTAAAVTTPVARRAVAGSSGPGGDMWPFLSI